ncbi:hypothetical protein PUV54_01225 [Hyphococcus flavus]|uniref:Uncharacterized protein n=1 Tax=Hyphococcus flavus TaxID=1866326 RepID=A0AAE9ZES5_9PROT|nr:hypothetical protein [Hyphococcus flavus]WDI31807.1 hypothetical protein PUV54_01225 [Hyphococcus flavus]
MFRYHARYEQDGGGVGWLKQPVSSEQQLAEQIRVNVAFEQMIVAVLAGAFAGGGLVFIIQFGAFVLSGGMTLSGFVNVFLETLLAGFLIFLVGFFSSVAIGAPLFMALEKRKRRNLWPYLAAAMGVALATIVFRAGGLPAQGDLTLMTLAVVIVPALIIALTFARLMKPHWRAAEKAEQAAAGPIVFRMQ